MEATSYSAINTAASGTSEEALYTVPTGKIAKIIWHTGHIAGTAGVALQHITASDAISVFRTAIYTSSVSYGMYIRCGSVNILSTKEGGASSLIGTLALMESAGVMDTISNHTTSSAGSAAASEIQTVNNGIILVAGESVSIKTSNYLNTKFSYDFLVLEDDI